jgi:hypothetical protein
MLQIDGLHVISSVHVQQVQMFNLGLQCSTIFFTPSCPLFLLTLVLVASNIFRFFIELRILPTGPSELHENV